MRVRECNFMYYVHIHVIMNDNNKVVNDTRSLWLRLLVIFSFYTNIKKVIIIFPISVRHFLLCYHFPQKTTKIIIFGILCHMINSTCIHVKEGGREGGVKGKREREVKYMIYTYLLCNCWLLGLLFVD